MPKIVYIQPEGQQQTLEVASGTTLMHAAIANGIQGIVAECGGSAMCATCHVYVDPAWESRLPPMDAVEDEMLGSVAAERRSSSRLSCQVTVTPELDGLVVHLPSTQI
ncbi:2Fe-2S iron-sulfur cluster-binding protein [Lacisediminimonas sp.]|uniref:2Fe-2S iron-sulfur cluster-binding protein n=1 Tax=Lacisediminimonas sp. TaxID=3060582 RepID=UPI0027232123|nr:2Fe-2S iron-sulfur cluster-binding protein [Lacisediminimonas sp.]MDO8299144.1 2Fe-2S iron-sulfur cluster-binding protein [Lacisediminimonas sp.]MDO9216514.1 2Fe-2S iron-sulfur cluster-binding protein [Lacisediminimonas sp.]